MALFSKMVLCRSWEANFLGEASGREKELQLTTFKGLILMCLFLIFLLELKHFRASNIFYFFSPQGDFMSFSMRAVRL